MEYKDVIESLKKCQIIADGRTYKITSVSMTKQQGMHLDVFEE